MRPFSIEWTAAFVQAINASADYRLAAEGWDDTLALHLEAAPEFGYHADTVIVLALADGQCGSGSVMEVGEAEVPITLRGSYAAWKDVFLGIIDPIGAVLRGRLAVDGSLFTLMRHTKAAVALVAAARTVPTTFPDL